MSLILPQRVIKVEYNGRTRMIYIPRTGDKVWDKEIEEWQREKTIEQLKKLPPLPPKTAEQKREVAGAIKEFLEWRRKKRGE